MNSLRKEDFETILGRSGGSIRNLGTSEEVSYGGRKVATITSSGGVFVCEYCGLTSQNNEASRENSKRPQQFRNEDKTKLYYIVATRLGLSTE